MATKTGTMSKVYRAAKKASRSKPVSEVAKLLKSQAQEAYREKLATVPVAELVSIAVSATKGEKSPLGADGTNLNGTSNRDVSIVGSAVGEFSTSASMYMYRPHRKRTNAGAVNYVQKTRWSATRASTTGQQAHWDISVLDASPVENNPNSNSKYTNLSIKKAFDDFLLASTAGNVGTSALKIQQSSIHVRSLSCEVNITNRSDHNIIIDIYEVVPKFSLGPTTYVDEGYATGSMSPSYGWSNGLSSESPQLEDTLLSTTVGSKPTDSFRYVRTWKEVKHVKVNLTAGSTHIHKMAYAINKTVSYQEFQQFNDKGGKFAGWNPTLLFRTRGVPSSANSIADSSSVAMLADMQLNYSGYMGEGGRAIVFDEKI
tara:strand:- start:645 stop:1760 length:1116 start_codon:yes stop_codon:yes gene_type:complete